MNLKRKKVSMKEEQKIITNMITSTEFMKQTKGIIHSYLLKSQYARAVAGWVLEYFEQTGTSPGIDIQDIYTRRRKELEDEEEVELVSEFLQELSNGWDDSQIHNTKYEVQNAIKYMKLRQLEQLKDQLETAVLEGTPEQGESALSNFKKVKEQQTSGVDLFNDANKVINAFDAKEEILFTLQGDLGKAIGPLCRGDFLAILGGPKSTKSYCMWYIARRAALLGLNIFIANFEMSENQYTRRAWQSMQGKPRHTSKVSIPYFEENEDGEGYTVEYREEKREGINTGKISERQKFYKRHTKDGNVRIHTFTSGVSTFSDVTTELENLEYYQGFTPDVIIFDYADIMAAEIKGDKRHQLDDIWVKIRGLATEKNCLCVTASQVSASAWGKDIKGKDADENKKKAAHVTKMFALNTTDDEMEKGMIRVQSLYEREGKRFVQQVVVLHSLDIGRWYLDSKFRKEVITDEN